MQLKKLVLPTRAVTFCFSHTAAKEKEIPPLQFQPKHQIFYGLNEFRRLERCNAAYFHPINGSLWDVTATPPIG